MTNKRFDLSGQVALVTGSTSGIGHAIAVGLAEAGAKVCLNGRSVERTADVAEKLRQQSFDVLALPFDVCDPDAIRDALIPDLSIDILINNAGVQHRSPILELEDDVWSAVLETNLTSALRTSRCVVPGMIARGHGKIINICSLAADLARPTIAPYAAAKSGLMQLTRVMCAEWAKHNVQVNGISPGYIDSEMNVALINDREFDEWVKFRTPAARWGKPGDLAGAAVFLASSGSDFVNGQILTVDGGIAATL